MWPGSGAIVPQGAIESGNLRVRAEAGHLLVNTAPA